MVFPQYRSSDRRGMPLPWRRGDAATAIVSDDDVEHTVVALSLLQRGRRAHTRHRATVLVTDESHPAALCSIAPAVIFP